MENIKPVGSRYLVKPFQAATTTESGLARENSSNSTAVPSRGTILAAGDTCKLKVGDEVYFRRYSLDILKSVTEKGEQETHLVDEEDVLAVIEKSK